MSINTQNFASTFAIYLSKLNLFVINLEIVSDCDFVVVYSTDVIIKLHFVRDSVANDHSDIFTMRRRMLSVEFC